MAAWIEPQGLVARIPERRGHIDRLDALGRGRRGEDGVAGRWMDCGLRERHRQRRHHRQGEAGITRQGAKLA